MPEQCRIRTKSVNLRDQLVSVALAWERCFRIAPHITAAISEYDAAVNLLGMTDAEYSKSMQNATSVQAGYDFKFHGQRFQIKAARPSGRRGSKITLARKAKNYEWDYLIWIRYDREYRLEEAWKWSASEYRAAFDHLSRLSPLHMQGGVPLDRR